MYCPVCLNDTLRLKSSGVVNLSVNGKQMDAGRFLYNMTMDRSELETQYKKKLEDFFKWYSNFQNKDPIKQVQLLTADISCEGRCRLPLNTKISIVDIIITTEELITTLHQLGKKYNILIELSDS